MPGPSDAAVNALRSGLASCQSPEQLRELQEALAVLQAPPPRPVGCTAFDAATAPQQDKTGRGTSPTAVPNAKRRRSTASGAIEPASPPAAQAAAAALPSGDSMVPAESSAHGASRKQCGSPSHPRRLQRGLPVTALCGFLGAGKTTLVRHLLTCLAAGGGGGASRVGLLVNDFAPSNIDAQLLALPPAAPAPPHATGPSHHCPRPAGGEPIPLSPDTAALPGSVGLPSFPPAGIGAAAAALQLPAGDAAAAAAAPPDLDGAGASGAVAMGSASEPLAAIVARTAAAPDGVTAGATAPAAAGAAPHVGRPAELLELSNGCVCCNLRGELQQQLRRLAARQPPLEHLVVECTGVGEPGALAAAIRALEGEGLGLELGQVVTVVDAGAFLELMEGGGGAGGQGGGAGGGAGGGSGGGRISRAHQACDALETGTAAAAGCGNDGAAAGRRPLAQLLAQQVEGADVVLLNKCDRLMEGARQGQGQEQEQRRQSLCACEQGQHQHPQQQGHPPERESLHCPLPGGSGAEAGAEARALGQLRRARAVVRALNPSARVLPCVRCAVPLEAILQPPGPSSLPSSSATLRQRMPTPPLAPTSQPGPEGACAGQEAAAGAGETACEARGRSAPAGGGEGGSCREGAGAVQQAESGAARSWMDAPPASQPLAAGQLIRPGGPPPPGSEPADVPVVAASAGSSPTAHDVATRANEEDEYGIGSYVFRNRVPFHPARLWALLQALAGACGDVQEPEMEQEPGAALGAGASSVAHERAGGASGGSGASQPAEVHPGGAGVSGPTVPVLPFRPPLLLRGKGFFWVASLPQAMWELSLAGGQVELEAVGRWLCSMVHPEDWPVGRRQPAANGTTTTYEGGDNGNVSGGGSCRLRWHRRWGDRCNELVFIGLGLGQLGPGMLSDMEADEEAGLEDEEEAMGRGVEAPLGQSEEQVAGAAAAGCRGVAGTPVEQLAALLRWAQLDGREVAAGEEVWEAWDDAAWLGLLEQF